MIDYFSFTFIIRDGSSGLYQLIILILYYFKIINAYGKYIKGVYRSTGFTSWGIKLIKK
jgi:hypothetical protein